MRALHNVSWCEDVAHFSFHCQSQSCFTCKKFHECGVFQAAGSEFIKFALAVIEFVDACTVSSSTTLLLRTASLFLKRCSSACLSSICEVVGCGSSHMCLPPLDRFLPQASILELAGNPLTDEVGDTIHAHVPCLCNTLCSHTHLCSLPNHSRC